MAFFEDRRGRGMNNNITIEVGGMLMAGRRCGVLKASSIERMPTDLFVQIYASVHLEQPSTLEAALHAWIRDHLSLGSCDGASEQLVALCLLGGSVRPIR